MATADPRPEASDFVAGFGQSSVPEGDGGRYGINWAGRFRLTRSVYERWTILWSVRLRKITRGSESASGQVLSCAIASPHD